MDSKNLLIWRDYTKEDTALVDSWLDADAVRLTGLDEGFDEFCRYWENESDPVRGEYFRCKIVSENPRPFAAIAFGYYSGTVTIMEIVVDPALRGQGRGTAVLREFIKNAADWIKQPISVFEAVVFENNPASQVAFYKAGFVRNEKDRDRWHKKADDSEILFQCKIASLQEMDEKWNYEIARHPGESNWIIWKEEAINDFCAGRSIPYYGILDGTIICEAIAMLDPASVQNGAGMMNDKTAYLCAFRTVTEFQGKGYFSKLLRFLLNDLKQRGYTKAILGVEPGEEKNKAMYTHWGFTEFIKSATEQYPDGTVIEVEYYGRDIERK